VATLGLLRKKWTDIQDDLITAVDMDYHVFDGRTFKLNRFEHYLTTHKIPWPRLDSGRLDLSDDAFRQQAQSYPIISPLRELRNALSEMRLNDLAVGRDGRNRCMLSAFRARSSRNAPSNTQYIFGPSTWLRSLIKPPPGHAFFYADWKAMEFGIAAALSGDAAMMAAYLSGDPYLAFAKQAGAVPQDATKETHGAIREMYKTCVLGVIYGMGEISLAFRIGKPPIYARELLRQFREAYPRFWRWCDKVIDKALEQNFLQTVFGWTVYIGEDFNRRSFVNFPMQANGAEIMRIAACLAAERGVPIGGVVHDAFAVCSRLDQLEADIATIRAAMAEAARETLGGFNLGVDVSITHWPKRYADKRGVVMWDRVMNLLSQTEERMAG
jgi:hypothetical protein